MKKLYYLVVSCIILSACQGEGTIYNFQAGDIIFQASQSGQSKANQMATHSPCSHMGIIYRQGDDFYVYEAVQPVKRTPFSNWVARGENGHYVVKRMKDSEHLLTDAALRKMRQAGEKYKGKDYDLYFEWSDERIYCSELVWKIYKEALDIEIGQLQKLSDFDLTHAVVKAKMKERYGAAIPSDERVISPAAMFDSDKLITVYSHE